MALRQLILRGDCHAQAGVCRRFVPDRDAVDERGSMEAVRRCLDGDAPVRTLTPGPGDLTIFRGRRALHRVTPTGDDGVARIIAVLAYNEEPDRRLSSTARMTFFGRLE
mmetsp:Transcript_566/g.2189  ORF Transcript_566/g.2189 Transcript_566/m.2189 type:complete len:109 (-) Transcript_566:745-1071(-)